MAQVNMDFNNKSISEKITKSHLFVTKLTGNANFTTPNPALAAITAATDAMETAYKNSLDGGKSTRAILAQKEAALDDLISILGAYIQSASQGDEVKILSSGAGVRKKSSPLGDLASPTGLLAKISSTEGNIDCKWDSIKGAKSYVLQICNDLAGTAWNFAGVATAAKYSVSGLESGKKYLFRVASVGAAGQSPWSDPAVGMAG